MRFLTGGMSELWGDTQRAEAGNAESPVQVRGNHIGKSVWQWEDTMRTELKRKSVSCASRKAAIVYTRTRTVNRTQDDERIPSAGGRSIAGRMELGKNDPVTGEGCPLR